MKKFLLLIVSITFLHFLVNAQTPYTISPDEKTGGLAYKGVINKYTLQNNLTFNWYAANQSGYTPESKILTAFESAKSSIHFILFGGTWCDDTQYILSRFFKIQELSGFPDSSVSFFGVDRDKKTIGNVSNAFNITNVPTIIVMKEGKEIGRVVEYGKTGKWDAELAEMIK
jgi:hypothetical protein